VSFVRTLRQGYSPKRTEGGRIDSGSLSSKMKVKVSEVLVLQLIWRQLYFSSGEATPASFSGMKLCLRFKHARSEHVVASRKNGKDAVH
jgi:hypothetical protein